MGEAMAKVFVGGDTQCGHRVGLTPPEFWSAACGRRFYERQKSNWDWFVKEVKKNGPFDGAIWMGDLTEGKGPFSGQSELIVPNLNKQIVMAEQIVEQVNAPKNYFVYGTPVHVRSKDGLELEEEVAKKFNAIIKGHWWIKINGIIVDARHRTASQSRVHHTRGNPLAKEREANIRWNMEGVQPLSQVYLRAHVHYIYNCGEPNRWQAYAVPALMDYGSKYGQQLSNIVHFGFGVLKFEKTGEFPSWKVHEPTTRKKEVCSRF